MCDIFGTIIWIYIGNISRHRNGPWNHFGGDLEYSNRFLWRLDGVLTSYRMLSKITKQDSYMMDVLAVCISLFHSIARIGCFFGGCCFGIESHSHIAINYTTTGEYMDWRKSKIC